MKEIYKNKNAEKISGKDAERLYSKMKTESKKVIERTSKLIEDYRNTIKDITAKMVELKTLVYESYAKGV